MTRKTSCGLYCRLKTAAPKLPVVFRVNVPVSGPVELSTGKTWLVVKGPPTALAVSVPSTVVEPVTNALLALVGDTWTRYEAALWNTRLPDTIRAPTALSGRFPKWHCRR